MSGICNFLANVSNTKLKSNLGKETMDLTAAFVIPKCIVFTQM